MYFDTLYEKIYCLIRSADFPKSNAILSKAEGTFKFKDHFRILFKSLRCLLIVLENAPDTGIENAANYIENIAIPKLIKTYAYTYVDEYCKILSDYFKANDCYSRSTSLLETALEIQRKMFYYRRNAV